LTGKVSVQLPALHQSIPVLIKGFLVAKDTKIHSLNGNSSAEKEVAPGQMSAGKEPKSIKQALTQATNPPARTIDPPGKGPLLKWSVGNELGVFGYAIYRADEEGGALRRLGDRAVRASAIEGHDAAYAWRDISAVTGKTYWYRVIVLFNDGRRQDLTGIQRATAK
jgi:hypothetical protein